MKLETTVKATRFSAAAVAALALALVLALALTRFAAAESLEYYNNSFFDGFESGSFETNNWTLSGETKNWTASGDYGVCNDSYAANIVNVDDVSILEKSIGTEGFTNVVFRLEYSATGLDSGEYFAISWFNGTNWFTPINSSSDATCQKAQPLLGTTANDNPNFKIRFTCKNNAPTEKCGVDNVNITGKDIRAPKWFNQSQEKDSAFLAENNTLSVYWTDNVRLSTAWLATNETGAWENKNAYGSPMALSNKAAWSNFSWQNTSVADGTTVCWRVYANDSTNNQNVTPIKCFAAQLVPTNLSIWDETDPEGGGQTKNVGDPVKFWANYSNAVDGAPVNANATCKINFNVSGWGTPTEMAFNSSSGLYEYTRNFSSLGTYEWNVSCAKAGYRPQAKNDTVAIIVIYTNLSIWDETDSKGGGLTKRQGEFVKFWANYTTTAGQPVVNTSQTNGCQIWFNDTTWTWINYNSSSKLYEHSRVFSQAGVFPWNVSCTVPGYERQDKSDYVTINVSLKVVSTNKPSYSSCGVVYYKTSLFNSNDQPTDSTITVKIMDVLKAVKASFSASTAGGSYSGSYKLPSSPTIGEWTIEVLAANVLGRRGFLVGEGNEEAWKIDAAFSPNKARFVKGENATLAYKVYNLKGIGFPGLWPSNTSLYIDGTKVTAGVVDEGKGRYSYEFNTSALTANAAHVARVTAWTGSVNATASIGFYVAV